MRHYRQVSQTVEAHPLPPGPRIGRLRVWLRLLLGRLRLRSLARSASATAAEEVRHADIDRASPLGIAGDPYRAATLFPFIAIRGGSTGVLSSSPRPRARDKIR